MSGFGDFGTLTTFGKYSAASWRTSAAKSTATRTETVVPWISVYFVRFSAASHRGQCSGVHKVPSSFTASSRRWRAFGRGEFMLPTSSAVRVILRRRLWSTRLSSAKAKRASQRVRRGMRASCDGHTRMWQMSAGDFLRQRSRLTAGGGLLYAGGADAAIGFVTGFCRGLCCDYAPSPGAVWYVGGLLLAASAQGI